MKKLKEFINTINWNAIEPTVYIRYILMILTIVNTVLTRFGLNPIQASAEEIYQIISDLATVLVLIVNTWKNNSVTENAIKADMYLRCLKEDSSNKE